MMDFPDPASTRHGQECSRTEKAAWLLAALAILALAYLLSIAL